MIALADIKCVVCNVLIMFIYNYNLSLFFKWHIFFFSETGGCIEKQSHCRDLYKKNNHN
jgi:hypothetical protein